MYDIKYIVPQADITPVHQEGQGGLMIGKTYQLTYVDQEKLVSLACRYKAIRTHIDEDKGILYVFTTSATNPEPTCPSLSFQMELVSDAQPGILPDEYHRRIRLCF